MYVYRCIVTSNIFEFSFFFTAYRTLLELWDNDDLSTDQNCNELCLYVLKSLKIDLAVNCLFF